MRYNENIRIPACAMRALLTGGESSIPDDSVNIVHSAQLADAGSRMVEQRASAALASDAMFADMAHRYQRR